MAFRDPKITGCSPIGPQDNCDELDWDKAIFLQQLAPPRDLAKGGESEIGPRMPAGDEPQPPFPGGAAIGVPTSF
jgi:hypothetical protein